ncbi:MAG: helix-turn-helix domain-containing protein [bacterium]|nr:helix-turn-helix domain-containing protein [bacterium]
MQNEKLKKTLLDLGLNEKEASVYLVALTLGPSTVLKIATSAELKRTTVYSVIESLKQKGLMSIEIKGWKKLFAAESPEKLSLILEAKREHLKKSLPEFSLLYSQKDSESLIKYYEGIKAVKSVYENILKSMRPHDDYLVIGNQEIWLGLDKRYFAKFVRQRAKLNINIKLILQDSPLARKHKEIERNFNEKIKILPKKTSLNTNLIITPSRVIIHQLTLPAMAMVIENKNIANTHCELFDIIWKSLK